jgi:hypothetical protein
MTRIRPSSRARAARRVSRHCDRTARSALSSCKHDTRKTAITASPMNFSTLPPCSSRIAGHVATMATLGVRSRSLAGERRARNPLNEAVQRTTANGRERLLTVAMQKVEGSSPFIRFGQSPAQAGFCCLRIERRNRQRLASAHLCPFERPRLGQQPAHSFAPKYRSSRTMAPERSFVQGALTAEEEGHRIALR